MKSFESWIFDSDPFGDDDINNDQSKINDWLEGYEFVKKGNIYNSTYYGTIDIDEFLIDDEGELKIQFGTMEGDLEIDCSSFKNKLKSLKNFPEKVNNLTILNADLENVDYLPELIEGSLRINNSNLEDISQLGFSTIRDSIDLSSNNLKDLHGCPEKCVHFICSNNQITSLDGGPKYVEGLYDVSNNELTNLYGIAHKYSNMKIDKDNISKYEFEFLKKNKIKQNYLKELLAWLRKNYDIQDVIGEINWPKDFIESYGRHLFKSSKGISKFGL